MRPSHFINIILFVIFVFGLFIFFKAPPSLSIWQGYTSSDRTTLSVLFKEHQKLNYFIASAFSSEEIYPIEHIRYAYSDDVIDHFVVPDLNPTFSYRFIVKNQSGEIIDERMFKTLDLNKKSITFAAASCMDDRWSAQADMWTDLLSFHPRMIFLIGDNVYADRYISFPSMENFWKRYVETIKTLHLYKSKTLIPILAIWDDHDYGMDNGDEKFKHKKQMQRLFRDFFFLYEDDQHLFKGYGVSFLLKTRYQNFFFLDDRSFKSDISLWGKNQSQWLLDHLSGKPSWIINGNQIFGGHHRFESFEKDFPSDFKKMINQLSNVKSPVIFLSGDRHLSELLQIVDWPYKTYEITTSPIHAQVYPKEKNFTPSARHIHHIPNQLNYAIIKSSGNGSDLRVQVDLYGSQKILLFSEKLHVQKDLLK